MWQKIKGNTILSIIESYELLRENIMATQKENIIQMIKNLPDDISLEYIIEAIYVRQKIEKGLKDSKEWNLYTHEDAKERLEKWLK